VTQTAEVEVNRASINRRGFWAAEIGKLRRIVPVRMTPAKLRTKILAGDRCLEKNVLIPVRIFIDIREVDPSDEGHNEQMNYRR
jgi:hypothetical protein